MEKDNIRSEGEDMPKESKKTGYSSDFSSDIKWREDSVQTTGAPEIPKAEENIVADIEEDKEQPAKKDKKRKRLKGAKGTKWLFDRKESFIMCLIDRAVVGIYDKTKNGAIGHFFSSYAKADRTMKTSATFSLFSRISEFFERRRSAGVKEETVVDDITGDVVAVLQDPASRKRSLLKKVVSAFENSLLIRALKGFISTLFYLPVSTYGASLLALGITTILVQVANVFVLSRDLSMSSALIGVGYTLISLMTIFAGDSSLAKYICESRLGSFILVSVFGVSKKTLDFNRSVRKYRFWAFLVGVSLGLLSAVFRAQSILVMSVVLILAFGIARNPESGAVITLFALPFASLVSNGEIYLCALVLYTVIMWVIKILGGQRRISFGALDGWMILFILFVFVTGLISVDRAEAGRHALVMISSMLGFFAVSNLLSSHAWMRRGINALLMSGFIVSAGAIYEWIANAFSTSWKLENILSGEISSVFASGETLSLYLVMIFFFALTGIGAHDSRRGKFFSFIVFLTTLVASAFTMNVYAWVTLIAVIMLYSLVKSKKNAASVLGLLVIIILAVSLVSDVIPSSLASLADGNFDEKFEVMRTSAQMAGQYLISGIGLGKTVFKNTYASLSASQGAVVGSSGSLFMEMLIRFGFMGVVFVVSAMILVYRQAFSTLKIAAPQNYAQKWTVAAISSLTAALLISCISYIWSDMSMAILFWMSAGFVSASRHLALFENTGMSHEEGPSLDLPISSFRRSKAK